MVAAEYGSVCLINSDSPTLPTSLLLEAARALSTPVDRVVLGPAEDGGYYLIAATAPHPALFTGIPWSTATVFAQTVAKVAAAGLTLATLPPWYDIDGPADLRRCARDLAAHPDHPAIGTRAFLRRMAARLDIPGI